MSSYRVMKRGALWTAVVLTVGACASAGGGGGSSMGVLTRDQLLGTQHTDLYTAVQTLRPQWLRPRGAASMTQTNVVRLYVNETSYGDVESLRNIPIDAVVDIRHLTASEATNRFGTGAGNGGALLVRTASQ